MPVTVTVTVGLVFQESDRYMHTFFMATITVTVTVCLFKCPKNKRPHGLPGLSHTRLHQIVAWTRRMLVSDMSVCASDEKMALYVN
jgi:hypothetical protein